jgi:hypothetical protein
VALYEYHTRPVVNPASTPTPSSSKQDSSKQVSPTHRAAVPLGDGSVNHWIPTALALGSLLFTLHQLLADASTLIAWSWTGYPITGPIPNLHGSLTIAAQALGLLLPLSLAAIVVASSTNRVKNDKTARQDTTALTLLSSPLWWTFGAASAYVLYTGTDWTAYAGGLAFAIFLMSAIPGVLQRTAIVANGEHAPYIFCTAWLVVSVLDFVSTMTVAYAFVSITLLQTASLAR